MKPAHLGHGSTMQDLGQGGSYEELGIAWARYQGYLDSVENELPDGARAFARASWHYDPAHHRCPHDSWIDELVITEGRRNEDSAREVSIQLRLLGAYHDGYATLKYSDVREYQLGLDSSSSLKPHRGHGDWLVDEVRLSQGKLVVHEISFTSGSRWLIECADIHYATSIPDVRDNGSALGKLGSVE